MAKRLLIVEDAVIIAMDLASQAEEAGWEVIGPAFDLQEALRLINQSETIHAAVLDVQLGGEFVTAAAQALQERGVPIVFGSGLSSVGLLPAVFDSTPALAKPFTFREVEAALLAAMT